MEIRMYSDGKLVIPFYLTFTECCVLKEWHFESFCCRKALRRVGVWCSNWHCLGCLHPSGLPGFKSQLLSQLPANACPEKQQMVQVVGSLSPMGEPQIKFPALGTALAVVSIWRLNQQMEDPFLFVLQINENKIFFKRTLFSILFSIEQNQGTQRNRQSQNWGRECLGYFVQKAKKYWEKDRNKPKDKEAGLNRVPTSINWDNLSTQIMVVTDYSSLSNTEIHMFTLS